MSFDDIEHEAEQAIGDLGGQNAQQGGGLDNVGDDLHDAEALEQGNVGELAQDVEQQF